MATPFRFKRSAVKDKRPAISDLLLGEIALNTYDGRLFGRRTGTGSTVALLNPWSERLGANAIYYEENVAIGASDPQGRKLFVDGNIAVTGVSTFTGAIDANGDLDVDGRTELDITNIAETLNVVGLSTFASNVDINADLDVDGRTELDTTNISETLNVVGITTIQSLLDVNGGLQANTAIIEDLTDNRVVISGPGGELEDDANFTFNGSQLSVGVDLDVDGRTELDTTNISETLNVVGIVTLASDGGITTTGGDLYVGGDLYIADDLNFDEFTARNGTITGDFSTNQLIVTGLSTFSSNVDINADLDVDGHTELDDLRVSGVATFQSNVDILDDVRLRIGDDQDLEIFHNSSNNNTIIQETTGGNLVIKGSNLFLQSSSGEDFFKGDADGAVSLFFDDSKKFDTTADGIDVTGHVETDTLNVSGIATIHTLEVTDSATLKHAGQTKLTTTGIGISVANGIGQTAYIEGPDEIWIDPHPFGVGNTSGKVRIRGDLYVDGKEFIVDSGTIELNDFVVGIASTVPTNMLLDGAGIGIGSENIRKFITYSNASDSLKSSENWNIAAGKHYEIDGVDVLTSDTLGDGVVNSSLTNVGTLTSLDVSGITTVAGTLDANGGLEANTAKIEDLTNDRVVLAGTGGELEDDANLTFNGTQLAVGVDLDVDGRTELDTTNIAETLNVVGITTLASAGGITTTGGDFYVGGDLYVLDDIVYDEVTGRNLNITGVGTFAELNVTGNVTLGDSSSDQINLNGRAFGHFIPANDDLFDLGSTTNRWQDLFLDGVADVDQLQVNMNGAIIDGSLTANAGVFLAMNTGSTVTIGGSFASNLIPSSDSTRDLGTTDVRWRTAFVDDLNIGADLIVAGVTTFQGKIEGAATNNVIPFLYANYSDLPSAATYHGAFAHVHETGKAYFAHANAWYELVNKDLNGVVGTGTETYNVGVVTTQSTLFASELNVAGVSTFVGDGNFINNLTVGGDLNVTGISTFEGNTSIGVGGTVLFADTTVQRVGINSTIPGYALDVVGDINSSTDIKVNGVSIVSGAVSSDDVVALAIALG